MNNIVSFARFLFSLIWSVDNLRLEVEDLRITLPFTESDLAFASLIALLTILISVIIIDS